MRSITRIGTIGNALVLILLLMSACAVTSQTSSTAGGTTTLAPPTPTPKPTVSAKALTLGGSEAAFLAKYGDPFRAYASSDEFHVSSQASPTGMLDISDGYHDTDPNRTPDTTRISDVQITPYQPDQSLDASYSWDAATGRTVCMSFLPPDARHTRDIADASDLTTRQQYVSQLLANTLPPSDFTDQNNNPLPQGTITIVYRNAHLSDASTFSGCGIWSGTGPD